MNGVTCRFADCAASMVSRIVVAAVDQLSAEADVDIGLLDAVEIPLVETVEALHGHGIEHADIAVSGGRLNVAFGLALAIDDMAAVLGDSGDLVGAFFDVEVATAPPGVTLTGSLG